MSRLDLRGQSFGRLKVIAPAPAAQDGSAQWLCRCDCGGMRVVRRCHLRSGATQSCGCLNREISTTHGATKTSLYRRWAGMRSRCNNPNSKRFDRYGARGIRICPEWDDFAAFAEWAKANGYAPNLTIDRINNDGNYEPSNCRWATRAQQTRNRGCVKMSEESARAVREYASEGHTNPEIARRFGISTGQARRIVLGIHWRAA